MAKDTPEPAISQRRNERARVVVDGKRTDDGGRCTLVAVVETGGTGALYPHGMGRFGVRLSGQEVRRLTQAILDGGR